MKYDIFHMHRCEQSGEQECVFETAHNDACKTYQTAYTIVFLKKKPRRSKHVGDNKN